MEVLKNVLLNWVLPLALALAVLAGFQALRKPEVAAGEGCLAPGFTLRDSDGGEVSLEQFRGRPVILNFWGTWCAPCRAELPGISKFSRKHPEVVVLGLAVDSGPPKELAEARRRLDIPFVVLEATDAVKSSYGVRSVPTTFYVDPEGVLRKSHVGVVTPMQLSGWVD